jgi:hypothetical protein
MILCPAPGFLAVASHFIGACFDPAGCKDPLRNVCLFGHAAKTNAMCVTYRGVPCRDVLRHQSNLFGADRTRMSVSQQVEMMSELHGDSGVAVVIVVEAASDTCRPFPQDARSVTFYSGWVPSGRVFLL